MYVWYFKADGVLNERIYELLISSPIILYYVVFSKMQTQPISSLGRITCSSSSGNYPDWSIPKGVDFKIVFRIQASRVFTSPETNLQANLRSSAADRG